MSCAGVPVLCNMNLHCVNVLHKTRCYLCRERSEFTVLWKKLFLSLSVFVLVAIAGMAMARHRPVCSDHAPPGVDVWEEGGCCSHDALCCLQHVLQGSPLTSVLFLYHWGTFSVSTLSTTPEQNILRTLRERG